MSNRILGFCAAAVLLVFAGGCVVIPLGLGGKVKEVMVEESDEWFVSSKIAIIDIDGLIVSGEAGWFFGGASVADVKERLRRAERDSNVVAVVLRINSPGGTATASDTIYREIVNFRERSHKPVVAALMGIAASGGYYVACAADTIVAAPTCITGSVGVMMQFYNVEGLYRKLGLRTEVVKSGEKKDIGSPTRSVTDQERIILKSLNEHLYARFKAAVREGRPRMTDEQMGAIADGRPVTAEKARSLQMIDKIGYLDEAIAEARSLANVRNAHVIMYRARRTQNTNIYAGPAGSIGAITEALDILLRRRGPVFLYLWMPGG